MSKKEHIELVHDQLLLDERIEPSPTKYWEGESVIFFSRLSHLLELARHYSVQVGLVMWFFNDVSLSILGEQLLCHFTVYKSLQVSFKALNVCNSTALYWRFSRCRVERCLYYKFDVVVQLATIVINGFLISCLTEYLPQEI